MTEPDEVRDATPEEVAASIVPVALREGTHDSEEAAIGWNQGYDEAVSQRLQDDPALFAVALRAAADRLAPDPAQAKLDRIRHVFLDERDRLRAVIENAPHADDCCIEDVTWVPGWEGAPAPLPGHCTCWKAEAL